MSFVNVAIRVRPFLTKKCEDNNCLDILDGDPPTLFISERQQAYSFDKIFGCDSDQEDIFNDVVSPLVQKAILGYNCTVFAYGQTGTGKTYTMGSDLKELTGKNVGIIRRVFKSIFEKTSSLENVDVEVSMYEIYQEKVYDLLGDNKTALVVKGFNIIDLTKTRINDLNSVQKLLNRSCKRRHTGETKQNAWSSRSHAIFTIFINFQNGKESRCAKLNLVDLAGCESVKKTGTQDNQFNEAIKINMGLLSIGQVINALSSNRTCVPYRESMITRILYDSLNKRNYITLIACISSNSTDIHETVQTLEFAVKAKKLKNKPELNSILQECPKSVPPKYRCTPLFDMKTPMKRQNLPIHSSTSVKRPRLDPRTKNTIFSENFSSNSELNTNVISPIAKMVMTKLEDRIPQKTDFFKCPELYDTMRQIIREELTINNLTLSTPVPKKSRKTLLPLEQNQLPISSSPIDSVNSQCDLDEGISLIKSSSNDNINLSGITPYDEDVTNSKENVLNGANRRISAPKFKVPELPLWINNRNIFAIAPLKRRSARLLKSIDDKTSFENEELNFKLKSLDKKNDHVETVVLDESSQNNQTLELPRRSLRLSMKPSNVLLQQESSALLEFSKDERDSSTIVTENIQNTNDKIKTRKSILKSNKINNLDLTEETKDQYTNRRKSVRIAASLTSTNYSNSASISKSIVYDEKSTLKKKSYRERKHMFSLIKQSDCSTDSESSFVSIQRPSKSRKSVDIIDTSQEDIYDENTLRAFPVLARRRSIRLMAKSSQSIVVHNLMATSYSPYKSPHKTLSKEKKIELLKNNILKILNKGTISDLKKLHTIGLKTAEQILLYRQLNGPYREIIDLKQILTRGKSFERFLTANCLCLDNVTVK